MTDPIADLITRIRNAYSAHKASCTVPHSHLKEAVANTLKQEGFLETVAVDDSPHKNLVLTLRYINREPSISKIVRSSKPGRRLYVGVKKITAPLSGYGISILSTSKGIMTDKTARAANLGGEILCRVY